jgi:hypothetical protein
MIHPGFHSRISKVCALVAATLILPVLAYAGGNQGGNNQGGNSQGGGGIPVVPETNADGCWSHFSVRCFFFRPDSFSVRKRPKNRFAGLAKGCCEIGSPKEAKPLKKLANRPLYFAAKRTEINSPGL